MIACLRACLLLCALLSAAAMPAAGQMIAATPEQAREQAEASVEAYKAAVGPPSRVDLFDQATLRLTEKLSFVHRDAASRYLQAFGRQDPKDLVGIFLYGGRPDWIAVLRFVKDGYVDATAIRSWTADDILASLRAQVAADNAERVAQGKPEREVGGWLIPPHFDPVVPAIAWSASVPPVTATRERDSDAVHNIAIFGREGYFLVEIMGSAGDIRDNRGDEQMFVDNLRFVDGKRFADFARGSDPVARAGLDGVFGVKELHRVGLLEGQFDNDTLMIFMVGGGLTLGAALLALARYAMYRRRFRR